ncbi:Pyridoxine 5'-phosphate synthase [Zhongshania aliphaticivorans]|uniref:Pyridoxine 5'-phosphate synthase n=1 Tax=Zhongshania aliphaticivorans TaxID=1470434 RepID=A0A5S9NJC7_9GAMM|nr:pyridoxine 5'-phosphate synthase [Zhongshania aliphaticivorans]CAA0089894.1 Pyridoxine 5'-phosphate synthase [Zhongshania aliphaticivorans]CAA0097005.1 Pyridoxine 5'-phosphate synthase [Zhongshania aliphaticivorans]
MTALSINLNKIALIRNSRDTEYPSVAIHAARCIASGANGITVHPRPDQRHIRADDCYELASMIEVEFNIEGNPFAPATKSARPGVSDYPGFMEIIRLTKPAQCTLVPDTNSQLTSDHGFDLQQDGDRLAPIIAELKNLGVRVSLFMDPSPTQIRLAKDIGADRIELYTGPYAESFGSQHQDNILNQFIEASDVAYEVGLGLNAGHDLNLHNLFLFKNSVRNLLEVSIGHAFTIDAIEMGLDNCIKSYLSCLR